MTHTLPSRPPVSSTGATLARLVPAALALALLSAFRPAPAPPSAGQDSSREILAQIRDQKDRSPAALFEKLGERRDAAGLKALQQALGELKREAKLTEATRAFRHFAGAPRLEDRALAFLERLAIDDDEPEARAAAKGLAAFGPAAHPTLGDVIDRGQDPVARAHALAPLLDGIQAQPTSTGLARFLAAWRAPMSSTHERGAQVLRAFRTADFLEQMGKVVSDEDAYSPRRELILVAVGGMQLEGDAAEEADEVVDRGLATRDVAVVYRALEAVVSRGRALRTAPLDALTRSEALELRRLANVALARLELAESGGSPEAVIELARKKDPAARQAAALELARLGSEEALGTLRELLADPDMRVRSEAIRAVAARRRPSSIVALIERVEAETGKLRLEAYWALRMLTGEDHGSRGPRWRSWWAGEGETFRIPTLAEAQAAEKKRDNRREKNSTKASFYGIEVVSDRLAFVIDVSGSMNQKVYRGKSRLDIAKEELDGVIDRLQGDDRFNLIVFNSGVSDWQDELVPADERNRDSARTFVDGLRPGGGTAIYDALEVAFEDESVDTIYFLSDGQPSGGQVTEAAQIRSEVARWNSARHVTIHCIAVGQDHALLRGLAEDSGGSYRRID